MVSIIGPNISLKISPTNPVKSEITSVTNLGILDTGLAKRYFKLYEGTSYPKFDDEVVKANESLIYYAYDHYAFGDTAWYPVVVSKGDNSTFSG